MVRRIIPVASGKGGVGKTTFATNFALALSRTAPTVLIDLDAGTSSVRHTIDVRIERDLYHFFRRGERLERCLTTIPERFDPFGRFADFAFVAAPRHSIEEITSLDEASRRALMDAINRLPATYVVLDLRAGLGADVLDFLPLSNAGILVFTPQHPAAVRAAGEMVRSLLFRKLRGVFDPDGPLAHDRPRHEIAAVNALLDRVEDSYDEALPNLDAFLADLGSAFGDAALVRALAGVLDGFPVYFVLNFFNGVRESFEVAVRPFITVLREQISSRVRAHNLGWLVASQEVHRANCEGRPFILQDPVEAPPAREVRANSVEEELRRLAERVGLPAAAPAPRAPASPDYLLDIDARRALEDQLDVLNAMYVSEGSRHVRDNLAYVTRRVLHVINALPPARFGQRRLLHPEQVVEGLRAGI